MQNIAISFTLLALALARLLSSPIKRAWWAIHLTTQVIVRITVLLSILLIMPACLDLLKEDTSSANSESIIAMVGNEPITIDQFSQELKYLRASTVGTLPSSTGRDIQRRALLDDLIERRLILQEADKRNVVVGIDEIENAFLRLQRGWSKEALQDHLQHIDLNIKEVKQNIRLQLLIEHYYRDHVFSRVAVTDSDLEQALIANPEVALRPEQVHAQQIVVKTEKQANDILRDIQRHKISFTDAAIKYSLSPEGKVGGDLGWFTQGVMPLIFDQVCFSLRPGQISHVVSSDYGFHLFSVLDKKEAGEQDHDIIRDRLEKKLRFIKENQAQQAKIASLKKAVKITVKEKRFAKIR